MPDNAATAAARLSSAPMMDGSDLNVISIFCEMPCAAYVQALIAKSRVLARFEKDCFGAERLDRHTFRTDGIDRME